FAQDDMGKARVVMKAMIFCVCFVLIFLFASVSLGHAADTQTFPTSAGRGKIRPLNHASRLTKGGGKTIYLDPAKPAKLAGLPKADLILITDIHGDHMDPDSIKEISKSGTVIYAPSGVAQAVTTSNTSANGDKETWEEWTIDAIPASNMKRGPSPGKLFHDRG